MKVWTKFYGNLYNSYKCHPYGGATREVSRFLPLGTMNGCTRFTDSPYSSHQYRPTWWADMKNMKTVTLKCVVLIF